MGKLPNSVEEGIPTNVGCLRVPSQRAVVTKVPEVYEDVGEIANVVAGGGIMQQPRSHTPEYKGIKPPLEAEVCS